MIDESAFEDEVRAFLDAAAPRRGASEVQWGKGPDRLFTLFDEPDEDESRAVIAAARAFRRRKFDAGLGWVTGPCVFGGRELSPRHELVLRRLEAEYELPSQQCFLVSLGMVAPTVLDHGGDALQRRYLRALYRGDLIGCQLFSEPDAGSDLAGVRTSARREGDAWRIRGQKVWTSYAHCADVGEVLCRTNPDSSKHTGLTAFLVDLHAPGVTVRPIRQMTGGASFNEVILDDVVVADDHRLGAVDDGWRVAISTLMKERAAVDLNAGGGAALVDARWLCELVRRYAGDDHGLRRAAARVYVDLEVNRLTSERAAARIRAGHDPGPEQSVGKLALTSVLLASSDLLGAVLGARLIADTGEWGAYAQAAFVLGVPGMRLGGGTDEILRNIVGERVLGLPKEPSTSQPSPDKKAIA